KEESGIQYLVNAGFGNRGVDIQLASGGVTLTLDGAGQTRALLSLAYEDSRVSIRSRPWLVAKSGEAANIFGGSQVPVISQRAEGPQQGGSASVVQQISYRDTGVTLDITPIVQANGLVDLTISQSLSEQRATGAASLTPTILTRNISTSLTLRDGQSLLMGGLISEGQSQGRSGMPGLARVPVVGRLFRADSYQKDRTELIVMVIPYVIADHRQGRELTDQIRSQLELHRRFL
ncbi:MAG: type II and III secretion system protein, partial [Gammaproteobacteria bacterium]|nr:type II and III secretion system protein [Gammaproteobacteria bacterium]